MRRALTNGTLAALLSCAAFAQSSAVQPAFEVADLKTSDPAIPRPQKGRMLPGGRIEAPGMTLKNFMMMAYGVQENMIAGGPKWADSERFDLVAKAPTDVACRRCGR